MMHCANFPIPKTYGSDTCRIYPLLWHYVSKHLHKTCHIYNELCRGLFCIQWNYLFLQIRFKLSISYMQIFPKITCFYICLTGFFCGRPTLWRIIRRTQSANKLSDSTWKQYLFATHRCISLERIRDLMTVRCRFTSILHSTFYLLINVGKALCVAGAPLSPIFPPCPFTSSSFALFYFFLFSLALTIFFFCPSLSFLPE